MGKDNKDSLILSNFLKSGLSTREMDKLMGHSGTRGWKSWSILKKYKLKDGDKGKLFLYSPKQSGMIIKEIIRRHEEGVIDALIRDSPPNNLDKYKGTYSLAGSEKKLYNVFSGETRNIIQGFFNPMKQIVGRCQFKGCSSRKTDTVHYKRDRPSIFMECARGNKKRFDRHLFRYDVYNTMRCFLQEHSKRKSICFLCKKHHNELHRLEKLDKKAVSSFKKGIIF